MCVHGHVCGVCVGVHVHVHVRVCKCAVCGVVCVRVLVTTHVVFMCSSEYHTYCNMV